MGPSSPGTAVINEVVVDLHGETLRAADGTARVLRPQSYRAALAITERLIETVRLAGFPPCAAPQALPDGARRLPECAARAEGPAR